MENNEIMEVVNNVEVEDNYDDVYEEESSGGMGLGMLIGAALTGAGIAAFNWGKKKYAEHKAKKEEQSNVGVVKFEDVEKKTEEEVEVK